MLIDLSQGEERKVKASNQAQKRHPRKATTGVTTAVAKQPPRQDDRLIFPSGGPVSLKMRLPRVCKSQNETTEGL